MTRCGETEVQVECDSASPMKSGTKVTFGVRSEDIMLFDKDSGDTL